MDEFDYTDGEILDPERDRSKPTPQKPGMDITDADRSKVEALSRNCKHCAGSGWATVYAPDYDGQSVIRDTWQDGTEKRRPGRTVAYCVCSLGRWFQRSHEKSKHDKAVFERTPDLEVILTGDSFWLANDPNARPMQLEEFETLDPRLQSLIKRMRAKEQRNP